jgi:hypothetical protein
MNIDACAEQTLRSPVRNPPTCRSDSTPSANLHFKVSTIQPTADVNRLPAADCGSIQGLEQRGRNPASALPTTTAPYLNDILERDHRTIEHRMKVRHHFGDFQSAPANDRGIRTSQAPFGRAWRWGTNGLDVCRQNQFTNKCSIFLRKST